MRERERLEKQAAVQAEARVSAEAQRELTVQVALYRRVVQASCEFVNIFDRATRMTGTVIPHLDAEEVLDMRQRLRAVEEIPLSQKHQNLLSRMRDLIGTAISGQHRWKTREEAIAELGDLRNMALETSTDAALFQETFLKEGSHQPGHTPAI